jgi:peptide/nickel transport system substrate-binding protein
MRLVLNARRLQMGSNHQQALAVSRNPLIAALFVVAVTAVGCAPQAAPPMAPVQPAQVEAPAPRVPKVLTIGTQRGIGSFSPFGGTLGAGYGAGIVHDLLTREVRPTVFEGVLAEMISVENGTWRLNPDGSMDTTWKLKPNVKWHDGTPFTADDMVFTATVYRDRDMGASFAGLMRAMESVSAPDALTFEIHWSTVDAKADQAPGLLPLPKHLLEESYRTNKQGLANLPYFTTDFVGLGPFKLGNWEPGIETEFVRFDDYYRGPATIDRIILRAIPDPNAMIANIMAGSVDVLVPPGPDIESAGAVKERWAGTGNQVLTQVLDSINSAYILQYRPELARPRNGLTNRDVREALYRAVDRPAMSEELTFGLAPVADSYVAPWYSFRKEVESGIPQYPYDMRRAQELLTKAGWVKGADGILVHQQTGDRFQVQLAGMERSIIQKQQPIIAQQWKALGAEVEQYVLPPALANDAKTLSTMSGPFMGRAPASRYYWDRNLHTGQIPTEANKWAGWNRPGYSTPESDRILDQLNGSIDSRERVGIIRQAVQLHMREVVFFPYMWEVEPFFALANIKIPEGKTTSYDVYEWQKS